MDNPNDAIARLTRERETSRDAGDILARGVAEFIRKYDVQGAELVLKKLLYAYMKVEAVVDRDIYKEMADLEKAELEKEESK